MSESVRIAAIPDCDFCKPDAITPAAVEGKTILGPWAYMCQRHFSAYGTGLGTGKGQRLILASPYTEMHAAGAGDHDGVELNP